MCKAGQIEEAYTIAKTDLEATPSDPWVQRAMGWVLYYLTKQDTATGNYTKLTGHLEEFKSLDKLTMQNDSMIFDNVLFKIAEFIKKHISPTDIDANTKLSAIFAWLRNYDFNPSKGYSFLLRSLLHFEEWKDMADFFDWWNLNKLTQEDYTPYVTQNGKKTMTLAERAFIANSKVLLKFNDLGRVEAFLPKLDKLMNDHPEMMYPGYFYGKLLLLLGGNSSEALKVIVPFARKKSTEFWVWQLLSDVFVNDEEKQLACLLRAINCSTQESFLGKVRIKLANLYIKQNRYDYARFQIDSVTRCYLTEGWKLPTEINYWMQQPWIGRTTSNSNSPVDYMSITNDILCEGANETIAVVGYVDDKSGKSTLIYELKKRVFLKLRIKVKTGDVLNIKYVEDTFGKIRVLDCRKVELPSDLTYAKSVEGIIEKRDDKDFAFLKTGPIKCFISPNMVRKHHLINGRNVKCLIILDYDKKKDIWNWTCVKF